MGPPPFSGGNAISGSRYTAFTQCFNGAAAFQRRKCEEVELTVEVVTWLQWGRRLSAAEISLSAA